MKYNLTFTPKFLLQLLLVSVHHVQELPHLLPVLPPLQPVQDSSQCPLVPADLLQGEEDREVDLLAGQLRHVQPGHQVQQLVHLGWDWAGC